MAIQQITHKRIVKFDERDGNFKQQPKPEKVVNGNIAEDDDVYGYAGDHNIRRKVEYREPDYNKVLGIELSRIIRHNYSWFFDAFKYKE